MLPFVIVGEPMKGRVIIGLEATGSPNGAGAAVFVA